MVRSTFSRRGQRRNDLGAEGLGPPAAHAVQRGKRIRLAWPRDSDKRDQPVGQEQSRLEPEPWRRLLPPLPERLDAAGDDRRKPEPWRALERRQRILRQGLGTGHGGQDRLAPSRDHLGRATRDQRELRDVVGWRLGQPHERLLAEDLERWAIGLARELLPELIQLPEDPEVARGQVAGALEAGEGVGVLNRRDGVVNTGASGGRSPSARGSTSQTSRDDTASWMSDRRSG